MLRWAPGTELPGEVRLLSRVGEGGMGEVWKAWSLRLHRHVAVKRLRGATQSAERVLREARAAARLRHPSVVDVYDCTVDSHGEPFVVMEWLAGLDLQSILERHGRLPPRVAVRLMVPVADALRAGHRQRIVHGDVKPGNVIFGRRPGSTNRYVKLFDYGIAALDDARGPRGLLTPEYAAPERLDGEPVSPHTDQWSLSVALYELCTGRVPFEAQTLGALHRAVHDAPLPFPRDASLDGALFRVLATGTRKRPEDRFGSMARFRRALADWLLEQGVARDACGRTLGETGSRTTG